jgi:hypothetical protein
MKILLNLWGVSLPPERIQLGRYYLKLVFGLMLTNRG